MEYCRIKEKYTKNGELPVKNKNISTNVDISKMVEQYKNGY